MLRLSVLPILPRLQERRQEGQQLVEHQLLCAVEEDEKAALLHLACVHQLADDVDYGAAVAVGQGKLVLVVGGEVLQDHRLRLRQHRVQGRGRAEVFDFVPEREVTAAAVNGRVKWWKEKGRTRDKKKSL